MRDRCLLTLALLIVAFEALLLGCGPPDSSSSSTDLSQDPLDFGSPETIDILTWNIESFPKDERLSPGYVVQILDSLAPDIVAIQEVWSLAHLEWVATTLGNYRVATVLGDEETGLAFLYNAEVVTLTSPAQSILRDASYDFGNRPPIEMTVEVLGQKLRIINLHFKCCGDGVIGGDYWDEEVRRLRATGKLKSYLDRLPSDDAVVALGDWNDILNDPQGNNIFQPLLDAGDFYRFTDLSIAEETNSDRWSFPSYPSHLDHILINRPLFESFQANGSESETILAETALRQGLWEYSRYVSDHRPVGLKLQLSASQ